MNFFFEMKTEIVNYMKLLREFIQTSAKALMGLDRRVTVNALSELEHDNIHINNPLWSSINRPSMRQSYEDLIRVDGIANLMGTNGEKINELDDDLELNDFIDE